MYNLKKGAQKEAIYSRYFHKCSQKVDAEPPVALVNNLQPTRAINRQLWLGWPRCADCGSVLVRHAAGMLSPHNEHGSAPSECCCCCSHQMTNYHNTCHDSGCLSVVSAPLNKAKGQQRQEINSIWGQTRQSVFLQWGAVHVWGRQALIPVRSLQFSNILSSTVSLNRYVFPLFPWVSMNACAFISQDMTRMCWLKDNIK